MVDNLAQEMFLFAAKIMELALVGIWSIKNSSNKLLLLPCSLLRGTSVERRSAIPATLRTLRIWTLSMEPHRTHFAGSFSITINMLHNHVIYINIFVISRIFLTKILDSFKFIRIGFNYNIFIYPFFVESEKLSEL